MQGAFLMADGVYPISMIYLGCVQAMCQINLKEQEEAIQTVSQAWEWARFDNSWNHLSSIMVCCREFWKSVSGKRAGNVQEACRWCTCIQPWLDEDSQSKMQKAVTDLLSPLEFSIAMLACRDWTNQEIAEHLGLSANTVKHYVSGILEKLQIDKRDKIKEFVNQ